MRKTLAAAFSLLLLTTGAHARKSRVQKNGLVEAGLQALQSKQYTAAINSFSKAARQKGDGASYFLLGYAYYQRGFMSGMPETADKQDALETVNAYMTAIALDPALSEIAQPYKLWHSLALSYEALGSNEKAIDAYKKAFETSPDNVMLPLYASRLRLKMSEVDKSVANLNLCLTKARQKKQEKAVLSLIKTSPLFDAMLASPAHARLLHSFDAAIPLPAAETTVAAARALQAEPSGDAWGLRDVVRESPAAPAARPPLSQKDQAVMDQLGVAAEQFKFRRYREAVAAYGEVLLLNQDSGVLSPPQLGMVHERVGTAYNRMGQSGEAIRELRRAVQIVPFNSSAHYQLALAYAVSGRYQESLKALHETFKTSASKTDLRRYLLLARTDAELEGVRDLPAFGAAVASYSGRR
jgi:tetratricopeptide (TPR) repeat protein